jgi:hypothetical protein
MARPAAWVVSVENDPSPTSAAKICCDAQHGFFEDVVGCDPRLEEST